MSYLKELQLLSQLRHEHIVEFLGHGTVDGKGALLMQFAEGLSLQNWLTPSVSVVYPPSWEAAVLPLYGQLQRLVGQTIETQGSIAGFAFVQLHKRPLDCTSEAGRRELRQAFAGLRIASLSSLRLPIDVNPLAFDLQAPELVVSVGPLAFHWPLEASLFRDPSDASGLLSALSVHLSTVPSLPLLERIRIACETWRGVHFLHCQRPAVIHSDIKVRRLPFPLFSPDLTLLSSKSLNALFRFPSD